MTDPSGQTGDLLHPAPELSSALARMAGLVLSRETVDTALRLVTALAKTTISAAVGAGVTIVDERGKRSRAASDDVVEQADALQYELDEGPCLDAWRSRALKRVDDTTTDTRWPRWSGAVVQLNVRSVLSTPLMVGEESIGALKVYSDQPAGFDDRDEQAMRLFAQQAAILLANTQSLQEARRISRSLTDALGTRDAILKATGVLLARGATDDQAAFVTLTDTAVRSGRTVAEVARELLAAMAARNADASSV
jgi:GAF domain-containing protein